MSFGFGATLGAGSADAITTALITNSTLRTVACWYNRNGVGGGSAGSIFQKRTQAAGGVLTHQINVLNSGWNLTEGWTTTNGNWTWTGGFGTGSWIHLVATYDGGSTANNPVVYINGVSQPLTRTFIPAGSLRTSTEAYVIGNRTSDSARAFDGMIAEFAIWDRLLTANEIAALAKGFSPAFFATPVLYVPLVRDLLDRISATTPTATGCAVQPHVPGLLLPYRAPVLPLGGAPMAATAAVVFAPVSIGGVGGERIAATAAPPLPTLATAAVADERMDVVATTPLGALQVAGAGEEHVGAIADVGLPRFAIAGAAEEGIVGVAALPLPSFTATIAADELVASVGAGTFGPPGIAGAAAVVVVGTGALIIRRLAVSSFLSFVVVSAPAAAPRLRGTLLPSARAHGALAASPRLRGELLGQARLSTRLLGAPG